MKIAYVFLSVEGIARFTLLYLASANYVLYGELSYIFTLSVLVGSLVSFGSGQVILFEKHKEDFCISVLLFLTIMAIFFITILAVLTDLNDTEIGFFAFLYPTLSLIAAGCRKSLNILIRFQKTLFWLCFLGAIFGQNHSKIVVIFCGLTNFIVYMYFVKNKYLNLRILARIYTTSLNIKFFVSSVSNNASRFLERTIMLVILPNSSVFGQFQALRDTCNLPMFLLGPLIGEKILQDKGLKRISHLLIMVTLCGLLVQFFFLERLIPKDITLILIVMICSLFDVGRVLSNVLAEISNLFLLTWVLKFLMVLSLLIILCANLNEFDQIFMFFSGMSFCYIAVIFFMLSKRKLNIEN